ncbi:MAG: DDE-type integrase/transposase/recombinase [Saprospiraceae bacterium]|jgi:hypothetical protein
MKSLYELTGITKQSLWKSRNRKSEQQTIIKSVVDQMNDIRKTHKVMGCRKMYYKDEKQWLVGRDKVIEIGYANGFKIRKKRSVVRTTWSQSVEVYPNLIENKQLSGPNQAWQSDIFYYKVGATNYYGVTIEDVYTRVLKALHISKSLQAKQTVIALRKAIKSTLNKEDITGCIFHSDRGSQYISKDLKEIIKANNMIASMCINPQENAYVERLQGTVKNEYLNEFDITPRNITQMCQKIKTWYNGERPHKSIGMLTPNKFENLVENLAIIDRPKMVINQGTRKFSTDIREINKKKKEAKKKNLSSSSLSLI